MSFIDTTSPEQARGQTGAMYERLRAAEGYLPNYARLFSHRPALMEHIRHLMEALREPMPPRLWKLANLGAARASDSSYCSLVFARKLLRGTLSAEQLRALTDGGDAALDAAGRAAMDFAGRVAREPTRIEQGDIDYLRDCGFSDTEIFDLAAAAAFRCFFSRIGDALGAPADAELAEGLDPELVQALCTGRTPAGPGQQPT